MDQNTKAEIVCAFHQVVKADVYCNGAVLRAEDAYDTIHGLWVTRSRDKSRLFLPWASITSFQVVESVAANDANEPF